MLQAQGSSVHVWSCSSSEISFQRRSQCSMMAAREFASMRTYSRQSGAWSKNMNELSLPQCGNVCLCFEQLTMHQHFVNDCDARQRLQVIARLCDFDICVKFSHKEGVAGAAGGPLGPSCRSCTDMHAYQTMIHQSQLRQW